MVLLTSLSDQVCGHFNIVSFRSARSKRVASSTMSAETLALVQGVEDGMFLQTWLYELEHPAMRAFELLQVPPSELISMDCCTDCMDLYQVLVKPAAPAPTNKSLTLYFIEFFNQRNHLMRKSWGFYNFGNFKEFPPRMCQAE